jgi:hypothetical protein
VHLISATGGAPASGAPLAGEGWAGVKLAGIREAVVIWRTSGGGTLSYTAPPGTHVILDATDGAILTAKQSGAGCVVALDDAESGAQKPLVATLDASCTVTPDPEAAAASAVGTTPARSRPRTRSPRSGCCGAEAAPGQSIAMIFVVGGLLLRRRRSVTRS